MTRTHQFEAMLPREFRAEFERAPVIYCPFGSVEYHGTHQSMAIDFSQGHVICLRAAAISGGVVHPTIPIVPGGVPRTMEELKFNFQACPPYSATGIYVGILLPGWRIFRRVPEIQIMRLVRCA